MEKVKDTSFYTMELDSDEFNYLFDFVMSQYHKISKEEQRVLNMTDSPIQDELAEVIYKEKKVIFSLCKKMGIPTNCY